MGGTSRTTQEQTQSSTTNPWEPAQPMLQNILGQLTGQLGNTGLTGTEGSALNTLTNNANAGNPWASQIGSFASSLLNGGGANNSAPMVNDAYKTFQTQTNPLASNVNYDPYSTPGFRDAVSTMSSDISGNISGMFAGAGRDMSGMHAQTLARGLAQGIAPTIASQYNSNVANQQNAAGNLYNAGNTTAGALSGMQQNYLQNQQAGIGAAGAALDANNYGANQLMQVEAARRGIPAGALGLLAQIGIPIAGLGGQSTGKGTTSGTQQMSGAQQFAQIAGGLGNLFGGGGKSAIGNMLGLMPSDRGLKEDIEQVGTLFDGQPVYRYRYVGSIQWQIGLMAQDVQKIVPDAVQSIDGFLHVDYERATDPALAVKEAA